MLVYNVKFILNHVCIVLSEKRIHYKKQTLNSAFSSFHILCLLHTLKLNFVSLYLLYYSIAYLILSIRKHSIWELRDDSKPTGALVLQFSCSRRRSRHWNWAQMPRRLKYRKHSSARLTPVAPNGAWRGRLLPSPDFLKGPHCFSSSSVSETSCYG